MKNFPYTKIQSESPGSAITASSEEVTAQNIRTIAALEAAARLERNMGDKIADAVAGFCGSIAFVWVHLAWFVIWIVAGTLPHIKHFDPFPFSLLTLVVSLEAIFLTTFVMISQNRQSKVADRRNHLDLQINLLSEQENSKMLAMLQTLLEHFNLPCDPEIPVYQARTDPDKLAHQIQETLDEIADQSASQKV